MENLFVLPLLVAVLAIIPISRLVRSNTHPKIVDGVAEAAKRLHLRDKGEMPSYCKEGKHGQLLTFEVTHSFCGTTVRIGITEEGEPVQYCHRCECVLDNDDDDDDRSPPSTDPPPPPLDGEPVPKGVLEQYAAVITRVKQP